MRFGAKNCIKECFDVAKQNNYSPYFYCSNGREMGWCCQTNERDECKERPELEIYCNYEQDFYEDLKYFSCVRETDVCGTSSKTLTAVPNMNQTLFVEKLSTTT